MGVSRHTKAEKIPAVKELKAGRRVEDVARELGVTGPCILVWKAQFGSLELEQEVVKLREENARLKKLMIEAFDLGEQISQSAAKDK
jgi:transposase-like protein